MNQITMKTNRLRVRALQTFSFFFIFIPKTCTSKFRQKFKVSSVKDDNKTNMTDFVAKTHDITSISNDISNAYI